MFDRDSLEELQAKLASANAAVAAHPLASDRVTRAHAIIESTDSDDKELVNKKLAEEDLPDLAEIGRLTVRHSVSWWKVNRKRNKIVEKIEKLEA